MFICLFYCFYLMNFNLISIIYIELSLFVEYFIFCCVTHLPEGPVNIFLIDDKTVFRDAYIFEDSPKGHIFIVLNNDTRKKIMKTSILYLEENKSKEKCKKSRFDKPRGGFCQLLFE